MISCALEICLDVILHMQVIIDYRVSHASPT